MSTDLLDFAEVALGGRHTPYAHLRPSPATPVTVGRLAELAAAAAARWPDWRHLVAPGEPAALLHREAGCEVWVTAWRPGQRVVCERPGVFAVAVGELRQAGRVVRGVRVCGARAARETWNPGPGPALSAHAYPEEISG